jgi:membrane-associated phospholipid phosphatase
VQRLVGGEWILSAVLVGTSVLNAQDFATPTSTRTVWMDLRQSWHGATAYATSPVSFSGSDWLKVGAVASGTVLLSAIDTPVRTFIQRQRSDAGDGWLDPMRYYGDGLVAVLVSGGVYGFGIIWHNDNVRATGLMMGEAVFFAGATSLLLKVIAGRHRPYTNNGAFAFSSFHTDARSVSLPSGHTTVAFALSTVISDRTDNAFLRYGAYTIASVVGISRIYTDDHWTSDVFLAAAIGIATGKFVVNRNQQSNSHTSLRISPTLSGVRADFVF